MPDPCLRLMENVDSPLPVECPCGRLTVLGEYVVAQMLDDGPIGLCELCAGQSPELAACVEALNNLAATAPDLAPQHAARLLCALVEQVARLAGPTVAFLNVNPLIIERINRQ